MIDLQTASGLRMLTGKGETLSTEPDAILLRQGRDGDSESLERLLARHEPMLLSLCRGILGTREDAEDAVQEAFLRALRSLNAFRGDSSVKTWLYRITVNVCIEWKRTPSKRYSHTTLELLQPEPSHESRSLQKLRIEEALNSLLPRHRAAIIMKEIHGMGVAEVGNAMGWNAIKTQNELYKARKFLLAWQREQDEREEREEAK